jgi:hypothetical protein
MIPALRERAQQGDRERRLAKETVAEMQAAGLFKVLQPRRWGGYELDILTYFDVQMALGEGDMSVAWVYGVVGVHPWLVALLDERAEADIWGKDDTTLLCSSLMPAGTGPSCNTSSQVRTSPPSPVSASETEVPLVTCSMMPPTNLRSQRTPASARGRATGTHGAPSHRIAHPPGPGRPTRSREWPHGRLRVRFRTRPCR